MPPPDEGSRTGPKRLKKEDYPGPKERREAEEHPQLRKNSLYRD